MALKATPSQDAFGLWLERSLHAQFEQVLSEPIPQALLDMIETDRQARLPTLTPRPLNDLP